MSIPSKETREIVIVCPNIKDAYACAKRNDIHQFLHIKDLHDLTGWGKTNGINKDDNVFWLAKDYFLYDGFLFLQYMTDKFGIEMVDMTGNEEFNCKYMPYEYSIH